MELTHGVHKVLTMNKPVNLNLAKCKNCLTQKENDGLTIACNWKAEVSFQLLDLLVASALGLYFEHIFRER